MPTLGIIEKMPKEKKTLLDFWEEQMKQSHTSSNYFFRKSPSHYHMMLLVMSAFKEGTKLSVEELKTKLFKTSRPKSEPLNISKSSTKCCGEVYYAKPLY